ncbi:MAG: polyprenyl synthetase family protein [Chloroflexota bacterium]|nr:polyprenyl synthetase family protein [Chloroflexota bacterium]
MTGDSERRVSALVERYVPAVRERMRASLPEGGGALFDILRYHLGWQDSEGWPVDEDAGKGLRPVLALASCEMAGGRWPDALPAAAALELIHNFSLLHDDIQDGDATRRGRPTAWTVYGVHPALAAGNAMRVVADLTLLSLSEAGVPSATAKAAAAALTSRYLEMIEGQYLDLSFEESDEVTTNDYLAMVSRKTGALIDCAMLLGCLVATNDLAAAAAFGRCGRELGLAFQVRDDLLGIWGDPAATGKPVGADIRRKKKSMPIVHLFQQANDKEREWLRGAYAADEVAGDDVERVLVMLADRGAREFVQATAAEHADAAVDAVGGLRLPAEAKADISAMADYFIRRDK